MTGTIEIPEEGGLFDGHFPGRPILPGVSLLILVARAAGCQPLREVRHARLRRPVAPGDRLDFSARAGEAGLLRVDVTRRGEAVASAKLSGSPPEAAVDVASRVASRRATGFPPIGSLLPHRAPMLFVTQVVGQAEDGLTCEAEIPASCALVERGWAPALAALEAAAQTAAVWEAVRRRDSGADAGPRIGYLVGMRDVICFADRIGANDPFLATVVREAEAPPLHHYRVEISAGAMPLARGTIATYLV